MRTKRGFRNAMGLAQIMATLLVVLPTLAFIVTILFDYWAVMQADHKLKLVANLTAEFTLARSDLRTFTDGLGVNALDYQSYLSRVSGLCPGGTSISSIAVSDAPNFGEIAITAQYDYNGTYFKNKTLTAQMNVYSYQDLNGSIVVKCQ